MTLSILSSILALALTVPSLAQQDWVRDPNIIGPEYGSLVIVGGGELDDSIFQRVIDLAGGPDEPLVVIPTAAGLESYDENAAGADVFRRLGATNLTIMHTYDRDEANTEEFVHPLRAARGVWVGGGRPSLLVDAYAGTLAEEWFWGVLHARGVIGGTSAGAAIQGEFLTRGDSAGDEIIGDHQQGFIFINDTAIDHHALSRNRQFDMFDVLQANPELLGLSIDDNTALVVQQNDVEVIGESYALFYDGNFWSREGDDSKNLPEPSSRFFALRAGDRYDLWTRQVVE